MYTHPPFHVSIVMQTMSKRIYEPVDFMFESETKGGNFDWLFSLFVLSARYIN